MNRRQIAIRKRFPRRSARVVLALVVAALSASVFALAANLNVTSDRLTTHVHTIAATPTDAPTECAPAETLVANTDSFMAAAAPATNSGSSTVLNIRSGGIDFTSSTSANNGGGSTSLSIAKPAGVQAGDHMLAQVSLNSNLTNINSVPADWAVAVSANQGNNVGTRVYWKTAGASEPATYTWGFTSSIATGGISGFTGVHATDPIAHSNTGSAGSTTTGSVNEVNPSRGNTRLVGFFATKEQRTHSQAAAMTQGYMEAGTGSSSSMNHEHRLTSGGTGTRSVTWTNNSAFAGAMVALRPAVDAEQTLVRFPSVSVPDGCEIDTAKLSLFRETTVGGRTITAERITASWAEGTVTWNDAPTTTTANAATSVTSNTNNERQVWDVKQLVLDMLANDQYGFMLKDFGTGDARQVYRSKDHATAADRPHLILTFKDAP